MAGEFAALMADLETLQKASPAVDKGDQPAGDDKKIVASSKVSDDKDKDENPDPDEETFGKAFEVTLADGTKAEAFDGTAMMKALHAEHDKLAGIVEAQRGDFQKAFEMVVGALQSARATIAEQADMLKALGSKLTTTAGTGTGRRAMVSIAEKLTVGSDKPAVPTSAQVMMKAQQMCRQGALGWEALPRIEAFQGRGQVAPPDLLVRFPELLTPIA